jgi:translation initiation factor eIF-2B subunit epsilon
MYSNSVYTRRTCKIGNNTLIGSCTTIADDVQIIASVIGKHCTIGAGSVVRDSYIFDGTSIGPECVVERSIVGGGVLIKEKSTVPRGCLIGDGVIIGPEACLEPFERLSRRRSSKGDGDEEDVGSDLEEAEACESNVFSPSFRSFRIDLCDLCRSG